MHCLPGQMLLRAALVVLTVNGALTQLPSTCGTDCQDQQGAAVQQVLQGLQVPAPYNLTTPVPGFPSHCHITGAQPSQQL